MITSCFNRTYIPTMQSSYGLLNLVLLPITSGAITISTPNQSSLITGLFFFMYHGYHHRCLFFFFSSVPITTAILVEASIFDILARCVRVTVSGHCSPGKHNYSGIYWILRLFWTMWFIVLKDISWTSMAFSYLSIQFLEKCFRFTNKMTFFDNVNILKQCYFTHDWTQNIFFIL